MSYVLTEPLLVSRTSLPRHLDRSDSTVKRLISMRLIPAPIERPLKGATMWSYEDLKLWRDWGMPCQREFEKRKKLLLERATSNKR